MVERVRTVQAYSENARCKEWGCERRPYGRGWCQMHYQRWRKHGKPISHAPLHPAPTDLPATDLAWCAGIMEGEGSVRINSRTHRNWGALIVQIVSTDKDMLEPFHRWWGGYFKERTTRSECKDAWAWVISTRQAARFLTAIEPYCRVQRVREKLLLGLDYQGQKHGGTHDAEYETRQHQYYERMKTLNRRGAA